MVLVGLMAVLFVVAVTIWVLNAIIKSSQSLEKLVRLNRAILEELRKEGGS